jgi:hypothetical protein
MIKTMLFCVIALSAAACFAQEVGNTGGLVAGGGDDIRLHSQHQLCLTQHERDFIENLMRDADAALPDQSDHDQTAQRGGGPTFDFYPIGGNIYGDLFLNNYTDLTGPISGILDWDCGDHTYYNHKGHDTRLRSFDEQFIGVPIFAALDGVVIGRDDGHPDQNTVWQGLPANFVVIDHGHIEPGFRTMYWHMKDGSVVPKLGDNVAAGQQIGLVASSGNSSTPHLHFEVWRNGSWVETMSGACSPNDSMWTNQWSKPAGHYVRDFGFLRELLPADFDPPQPFPRDRSATLQNERISYWMQGANLPMGSTYRFRFYMPNGVLDFDSGNRSFTFPDEFYRQYWARYQWNITDMRNVPGVWRVAIDINDKQEINARVTVLDNGETYVNTAPLPAIAAIEPAAPTQNDVIFVRLQTDLVNDDFEYDLVRYRYIWTLDGTVVRDTISAGHADAIPSVTSLGGGTQICVSITPNDGDLDGFTTNYCVDIATPDCTADVNGDGAITPTDFTAWINAFNNSLPECDQNGDGSCTPTDFTAWIANFNAGC